MKSSPCLFLQLMIKNRDPFISHNNHSAIVKDMHFSQVAQSWCVDIDETLIIVLTTKRFELPSSWKVQIDNIILICVEFPWLRVWKFKITVVGITLREFVHLNRMFEDLISPLMLLIAAF